MFYSPVRRASNGNKFWSASNTFLRQPVESLTRSAKTVTEDCTCQHHFYNKLKHYMPGQLCESIQAGGQTNHKPRLKCKELIFFITSLTGRSWSSTWTAETHKGQRKHCEAQPILMGTGAALCTHLPWAHILYAVVSLSFYDFWAVISLSGQQCQACPWECLQVSEHLR